MTKQVAPEFDTTINPLPVRALDSHVVPAGKVTLWSRFTRWRHTTTLTVGAVLQGQLSPQIMIDTLAMMSSPFLAPILGLRPAWIARETSAIEVIMIAGTAHGLLFYFASLNSKLPSPFQLFLLLSSSDVISCLNALLCLAYCTPHATLKTNIGTSESSKESRTQPQNRRFDDL